MRYLFGEYVLDTGRHELVHKDESVKLRPKVFQVLSYLVLHRDRMVPKAELLDEFWPRTVGEEVLTSCIMSARRAVGDDGRNQDLIKTTHSVGFRFVASVRELSDEKISGERTEEPQAQSDAKSLGFSDTQQDQKPSESTPPTAKISRTDTEQKTVTVLACGIKGAAKLADQLGPELTHEYMEEFFSLTQHMVTRYGGSVIQWLGDGFLALFGAPVAHEDDARRAALTALELCILLNEQSRFHASGKVEGDHLASVGLHTGPVIVGNLANLEGLQTYTARGKTTDLAVQLQREAEAGSVHMSEETFLFVESEVETEPCIFDGEHRTAHRLLAIPKRHAGVPKRSHNSFARFVGRREELAILRERLSRALTTSGQIVSISGAAGIGKSRLVAELCRSKPNDTVRVLRGQCLPYARSTPYLPLTEIIREFIAADDTNDPLPLEEKIHKLIENNAMPRDAEFLLLELLGAPVDKHVLGHLSPHARRMQTFELLRELLLNASRTRALVIVVEDLHWIDATSEAWLEKFLSRLSDAQILVVLTYRPGYGPVWLGRASATQLSLPPLTDDDSEALVRAIREEIPNDIAEVLVARAAGNPFFLEELTHSLGVDLDQQTLERVPDSIKAVLASRIDHLGVQQKQLLQTCSVIGTPVLYGLLQHLSDMETDEIDHSLGELEDKEFLFEMRGATRRFLRFKHSLTQDATYRSLPPSTRINLHARIAETLERHFCSVVETQPELLALHHKQAGNAEAGIHYWARAARQAYERSANVEAIDYANEGLKLLQANRLVDGHDRTELSLQLTLAPALMAIKGYGAAEVEPVYRRARTLCENIGDKKLLFRAQIGLWNYHWVRAELDETRVVAQQLVDLAGAADDIEYKLRAHGAMGEFLFHTGELEDARVHLTRSVALFKETSQPSHATSIPAVVSLCYASWVLWHSGESEQSLVHADRALSMAKDLSHPLSQALCLSLIAELHQFRLEVQSCLETASEAVSLSQTHGLPFWEGTAMVNLGWAQALTDDAEDGLRCIKEGIEIFSTTGARVQMPTWLGMLAEVYGFAERYDDGLQALREGMDWIERTKELHYKSELYRIQAELLWRSGSDEDGTAAKRALTTAIEVASKQGARIREIRARTSLALLLRDTGRDQEIRDLIAPQRQWLGNAADGVDVRNAHEIFGTLD